MKHLIKKSNLFILIMVALLFAKTNAVAQVSVQIVIAPPMMPIYEQPACPVDGYIWTPGYWAYGYDGYYWVEGVWLYPAQSNFLWTPGYWGYAGGYYGWNVGYWGPHVGYYGGVCYGHGYDGEGYSGGRWEGGSFRYNTEVSNVKVNVVSNTYSDKSAIRNNSGNRSSFNGEGGITTKPTDNERMAMNESHVKPNSVQISHEQAAIKNNNSSAPVNKENSVKTGLNKSNNQQTTVVNSTPTKTNVVPKQQNNVPQQNNGVAQQHNEPKQQNTPQQQRGTPQQQHSQSSGGGGHRK
ncbi:MAG TPA: YXWGXW repeat-containing protein [Bacteroidia bacterium]